MEHETRLKARYSVIIRSKHQTSIVKPGKEPGLVNSVTSNSQILKLSLGLVLYIVPSLYIYIYIQIRWEGIIGSTCIYIYNTYFIHLGYIPYTSKFSYSQYHLLTEMRRFRIIIHMCTYMYIKLGSFISVDEWGHCIWISISNSEIFKVYKTK